VNIRRLYDERCQTPHNIDKHLHILYRYARECDHITEFGTDIGFSTTAFLLAQPGQLHCYDVNRTQWVDTLLGLRGRTKMEFHQESTLECEIAETDLLFIDTEHTYEQVKAELERHGHKARKFLVFHDIVSFPCIVPAIQEYVAANPHWVPELWDTRQNGLAVYRSVYGQKGVWNNPGSYGNRVDGLVQPTAAQ
jgi:predicted O-methyltransferase YrrM